MFLHNYETVSQVCETVLFYPGFPITSYFTKTAAYGEMLYLTEPALLFSLKMPGSNTLQDITYMGATNELYVHSWDGPMINGIAWRSTDASGTTLNQGEMPIPFARNIDVALFPRTRQ